MEGPISFWGYKEQESNLILPEHDDDDDACFRTFESGQALKLMCCHVISVSHPLERVFAFSHPIYQSLFSLWKSGL